MYRIHNWRCGNARCFSSTCNTLLQTRYRRGLVRGLRCIHRGPGVGLVAEGLNSIGSSGLKPAGHAVVDDVYLFMSLS